MIIKIPLDILFDIFESRVLEVGMRMRVPGDIVLKLLPLPIQDRLTIHDESLPIPVDVIFTPSVSILRFVGWLHPKLARFKYDRIAIDGRWIDANPTDMVDALNAGDDSPIC